MSKKIRNWLDAGGQMTSSIRSIICLYVAGALLGLVGGFFVATAVWGWTELVS